MKPVWYNKKGWIMVIHAIAWIALFSLPFLLRTNNDKDATQQHASLKDMLSYIFGNLLWIMFFYFNALFLIPRLLTRSLLARYGLALVFCYSVIAFFQYFLFVSLHNNADVKVINHLIFNFLIFLFFLASSIAYRLIIDKIKSDNLIKDKENENLKTELSLLRSQASPHFLFNVLNNMVALARKKSDLLEPSLIKLSSLIRYTVYETMEEKVSLDKEIDYLESYIDLQRQRFGNNVVFNISFQQPGENFVIEPMLLIPFVENAIKHGTGFIENAHIIVELKMKENILSFFVRNRYNETDVEVKDKTSGIGLTNVKRRLNLLYPVNHQLQISKKDGWFAVMLQLTLH
jgi:two-component system, LytTR family, sensor kinase